MDSLGSKVASSLPGQVDFPGIGQATFSLSLAGLARTLASCLLHYIIKK